MQLKSELNKTPNRNSDRHKAGNNSDLWLECARRGLIGEPLIQSAIQQLSITYDFGCEQLVRSRIRSYDIQELLNTDPFRSTNPNNLDRVQGQITLGKVNHSGLIWGISPSALTEHLVLIGRTGGGKTTVIKSILSQLLERKTG